MLSKLFSLTQTTHIYNVTFVDGECLSVDGLPQRQASRKLPNTHLYAPSNITSTFLTCIIYFHERS